MTNFKWTACQTIFEHSTCSVTVCVPLIVLWGNCLCDVINWLFFRLFAKGFTSHSRNMETSPLPVKAIKFWPILGTHDHWAVRVLHCATPTVTRHRFILVFSEDQLQPHPLMCVWQWSCHYLSLQLRSVAAGVWTRNLSHAMPTL